MPDPTTTMAELAFGEAFGTSLLVGALLRRLVQKKLLSDPEVAELIDQVLLHVETLQETYGVPKYAVARARATLEDALSVFSSRDQMPRGSP